MPVLSSSVSEARRTASADPKCSTSFRARVGPSPGVSEMASHSKMCVVAVDAVAIDKTNSERTVTTSKRPCQGHASQPFVKIVESMRRLRISAISYLNTAPLMWDFEHGNAGRDFDISYTLPSACARSLAEGTA